MSAIINSHAWSASDVSVSIAIPTYNRAAWLRRMLESLAHVDPPQGVPVEVIVVDNASTDETARLLEKITSGPFPFPFRCVHESQQGLDYARNRALNEAWGNWVVFYDDDVLVHRDWLTAFVSAVRQHKPDCVIGPVFPLFETPPPSFLSSAVLDSVTSGYSRKGEVARILSPQEAHQIPGCNFAVRKDVAQTIGGFDVSLDRVEKNVIGYGDWEFGRALVQAGKIVFYEPRCRVEHAVDHNKLSRNALRSRWFGFGAAARLLGERRGRRYTFVDLCKTGLRAVAWWAASRATSMAGRRQTALEWELKAYREWGFVRGLPRTQLRKEP